MEGASGGEEAPSSTSPHSVVKHALSPGQNGLSAPQEMLLSN